MAHFKRGRCRRAPTKRGSDAYLRKRLGLKPYNPKFADYGSRNWWRLWPRWLHGRDRRAPAWFDRTFHNRPHRMRTRAVEKKVLRGADPDELLWPMPLRPYIYWS